MNNAPVVPQQHSVIQVLKSTLPEDQWPRALRALRQDPMIWSSLFDDELLERAVGRLGSETRRWSPAEIALLAARAEFSAEDLRRDEAFRPTLLIQDDSPADADSAGSSELIQVAREALELRNRSIEASDWAAVFDLQDGQFMDTRPTLLACTFDLCREPFGLLKHLIDASARSERHDLGLHALLSNPLAATEQVSLLEAVLIQIPRAIQISVLQKLKPLRPELVQKVAENLILGWASENADEELLPIDEIRQAFLRAELERLAQNYRPAVGKLHRARQSARSLQAHLAATLASVVEQCQPVEPDWLSPLNSWQEAVALSEATQRDRFTARLALAHLDGGLPEEAAEVLPDSSTQYEILIARSLVEAAVTPDDRPRIRQLARAALRLLQQQVQPGVDEVGLELIQRLGALFIQANLPAEAAVVAEIECQQHPHDIARIAHLGQTYAACGRPAEAAATYSLAVGLAPERLDLRRSLASSLEAAADWQAALTERTILLERIPAPESQDLRDLANCALMTGKPETAIEVCQQALEIAPNEGLTYALLGEAYFEHGDTELAAEALQKATQLTPDQAAPWLSLANVQRKMGEPDRALETLRSATHGAPEEPQIFAALGEAYAAEGTPAQAASALERATQLAPDDADILYAHGRILMRLGKTDQAQPVLREAYTINPTRPDLAHMYARAELELGNPQSAIRALAPLVRARTVDPEVSLDYARALLDIGEDVEEAADTLQAVLQTDPHNLPAQALLAEAHCASDRHEEALQAYRKLLDSDLTSDPEWKLQLMYGVGRASLGAGNFDAAIAAFQETLQIDDPQIEGYRHLAEAYQAAGLRNDALDAAMEALKMDPEGLDTLTWFARICALMSANVEAISALERAIELAPDRTDLLALLGQTQISSGNEQTARESFEKLISFDDVSTPDLAAAAEGFLALGLPAQAASCLERAVAGAEHPEVDLLIKLSDARGRQGDSSGALAALDQAMQHATDLPPLYSRKAEMLLELDRHQAALACAQAALSLAPESTDYLRMAAVIFRAAGDFSGALSQAEQWLRLSPEDLAARHQTASLAREMLLPDYARRILRDGWRSSMQAKGREESEDKQAALAYFTLFADLCLDADEEIAAAEALTEAIKLEESDSRVQALQARIDLRNGDANGAAQQLREVSERWVSAINRQSGNGKDQSGPLSCALAAEEAGLWKDSLELLATLESQPGASPLSALATARAIVRRAERRLLCEELQVSIHAPGDESLSEEATRSFQDSLRKAQLRLKTGEGNQEIRRWEARGAAVFHPDLQNARELQSRQSEPEDTAALIAVFRRLGDAKKGVEAAATYPLHPLTQLQLALTIADAHPSRAMAAARAACEREKSDPVFLAALARTAAQNGQLQAAYLAIMNALEAWPDEPAWHARAADILLRGEGLVENEPQTALEHLGRAARLEPGNHLYAMRIGQIQLELGQIPAAIEALESARDLNPADARLWLDLSKAYRAIGKMDQADEAASQALHRDETLTEAHRIRAEIALESGNAAESMRRSRAAVELAPGQPQGYLILAQALGQLGQPEEARAALQQGIDHCAAPLQLLLRQLELIEELDGEADAVKAVEELAARYPEEAPVHLAAVRIFLGSGRLEAACTAARQALRFGEDVLESQELASLHHTLGRIQRRDGQLDQAVHHLSEAVRQDDTNLDAYLDLGRAYLERREYEQALQVFQTALKTAPKDPRPYYQAGLTLKEGKDYVKAEEMLRRAAELAPNDVAIHRQLGAVVALNIVHSHHQAPVKA